MSISKLFGEAVLTASCLFEFGISLKKWTEDAKSVYPVHFVTPLVGIMTYLATILLVIFHRKRGIRSSGLLFTFWTTVVIFGLPRMRSVIRSEHKESGFRWPDYSSLRYFIYYGTVVIIFILNCFSDKRPMNEEVGKNPSPEVSASFLRKVFFQWFDSFMWRGLRNPIHAEDVWDLKSESLTRNLNEKFDRYWTGRNGIEPQKRSQVTKLLMALYHTVGQQIWTTGILKIIHNVLLLAAPQVLG